MTTWQQTMLVLIWGTVLYLVWLGSRYLSASPELPQEPAELVVYCGHEDDEQTDSRHDHR